MKQLTKWTILIIGIAIVYFGLVIGALFFLFSIPTNDRDNHDPEMKAEMIEATLEWARLAPFPQNARNFEISTKGNPFTRTFTGSFTASEQSIKSWVERSSGLRDAETEVINEGEIRYIIKPGGGASVAEVRIDYNSGGVWFYASWS